MVLHSSRGTEAGVMTCGLLLAALPSNSSGPRQRIPGITPGLGFLGHPPHAVHAGDPCSPCVGESAAWVPPFLLPVLRSRRAVLSTGFRGSDHWSASTLPAPILSHFGQAGKPASAWCG